MMMDKSLLKISSSWFLKGTIGIFVGLIFHWQLQAQGVPDQPALKPDVPKLDTSLSEDKKAHYGMQRKNTTLQGSVQRTEKTTPGRKKLGASQGQIDRSTLKSRLKDDRLQAEAQLGFGIIGVKFVLMLGRAPVIDQVFPNTPAQKVGLKLRDVIVAVDGIPTIGLTKDEVYDLIIGSPGTPVTISVMRGADFQVVTCTRMDINEITDPEIRRDYIIHM